MNTQPSYSFNSHLYHLVWNITIPCSFAHHQGVIQQLVGNLHHENQHYTLENQHFEPTKEGFEDDFHFQSGDF